MAKANYSKSAGNKTSPKQRAGNYGATYKDRNLAGANPLKMQEEIKPTEAEPVNMHKRMAGCS